ncbi:MAG: hypothetical protein R3Y16_07790 [Rikenellaceae bacterium]
MGKPCEKCKLRAAYDKNNRSFIGRFWRWHINFCPGWRLYYNSLPQEEQQVICKRYSFKSRVVASIPKIVALVAKNGLV